MSHLSFTIVISVDFRKYYHLKKITRIADQQISRDAPGSAWHLKINVPPSYVLNPIKLIFDIADLTIEMMIENASLDVFQKGTSRVEPKCKEASSNLIQ